MPNYVEYENKLQTIFESENLYTFANLVLETKILSFYLISKNLDDNKVCYKYYEVLIKGKKLIKTTDLSTNSYSFQNIDEILLSYFRLLSNHLYEHYFNNFLENLDRVIEISGLMHGGLIPFLESRIINYIIKLLLLNASKNKSISNYQWESALKNSSITKNDKISCAFAIDWISLTFLVFMFVILYNKKLLTVYIYKFILLLKSIIKYLI